MAAVPTKSYSLWVMPRGEPMRRAAKSRTGQRNGTAARLSGSAACSRHRPVLLRRHGLGLACTAGPCTAGPLADKLQGEIRGLAARVPGAPPFAPHVTLLGGVRSADEAGVLATARQLAQQLKVRGG